MAGISVTSFNGNALQSSAYATGLEKADSNPFLREVDLVQHRVPGQYARHVRSDPRPAAMALHVSIIGTSTLQTRLDELMGWFRPGTEGALIVDFDGSSRTVTAVVERIIPQRNGPTTFLVILSVPDPRWKSASDQTSTNVVVATPTTIVVANDGNADEDGLVIDVGVNTNKAAANSWLYAREIVVANRVPRALLNWAFDVTDGGIDHAALVTAVKSQADGDDVRVLVDGVQVDRWDGEAATTDWNSAATQVWINLTLSPGLDAELATATTAVSPANGGQIDVEAGGTAGWPDSGLLLIDDEVMRYSGKTDTAFLAIQRAQRSTTAAVHAVGTAIYWVERRVQLVYGHTGVAAPAANDHKKPLIDLTASSNTSHKWTGFEMQTDPRTMQWGQDTYTTDSRSGRWFLALGGTPTANLAFYYFETDREQSENFRQANAWVRDTPVGVNTLTFDYDVGVPDVALQLLAVTPDGATEVIESYQSVAAAGSGSLTGANGTRIAFLARQQAVVKPQDTQVADDDTFTTTEILQPFTVPDTLGLGGYITSIWAQLSTPSASPTVRCVLKIEDPATPGTYLAISDTVDVVVSATTATWTQFAWTTSNRPRVFPGQTIYISIVRQSGAVTLTWYGGVGEYEGASNYRHFAVASLTLDQDADTFATPDGSTEDISVDNVVFNYATAQVPYANMLAETAIYWHNWTLNNTTTGQTVTADLFLGTGSVLRIDVANRRVYNPSNDDELLFGVTFSDEENWITLEPGNNSIDVTETGLVSIDVDLTWRDRWQ